MDSNTNADTDPGPSTCLSPDQVLRLIHDFYVEWLELQRMENKVRAIRGFRVSAFSAFVELND